MLCAVGCGGVVAVKFRCVVVLSLLVVRFSGLVFLVNRANLRLNFNEMQPWLLFIKNKMH